MLSNVNACQLPVEGSLSVAIHIPVCFITNIEIGTINGEVAEVAINVVVW